MNTKCLVMCHRMMAKNSTELEKKNLDKKMESLTNSNLPNDQKASTQVLTLILQIQRSGA